jgi:hypothetical protein
LPNAVWYDMRIVVTNSSACSVQPAIFQPLKDNAI